MKNSGNGFADNLVQPVESGISGCGRLAKGDVKLVTFLPMELDEWMRTTSFPSVLNVILSTSINPPRKSELFLYWPEHTQQTFKGENNE